jgi:hypothetical protein
MRFLLRAAGCGPRGPSPGPSPLVPRGEGRIRSRFERHRTASAGRPPSPGLSPPNCRGERRTSIPLRQVRRTSHAVWGGRAGERGGPPSRAIPSQLTALSPHINLPRQFRGRWAGGAGPEGACPESSEAPHTLPHVNLPQTFLGEVGGWCPPGGGAPERPGPQSPAAFFSSSTRLVSSQGNSCSSWPSACTSGVRPKWPYAAVGL